MLRRIVHKQVKVIWFAIDFNELGLEVIANLFEDDFESFERVGVKYLLAILCDKDQVNMKLNNTVSTATNLT